MSKCIFDLVVPVLLLLLATALIAMAGIDMKVARQIYESHHGWIAVDSFPWNILYTYAPLPGFVLAGGAFFVFVAGFFKDTLRPYRNKAAFMILMLCLGPGLLVNVILKDNMGRARPADIIEFGGEFQYSEPWQYGISPKQKSFPSGHASIAFYLIAPWFIYRNHSKKKALSVFVPALSFGLLVGFSRMLQGGHFFSDVLWAGAIVYLCGCVLSWGLLACTPKETIGLRS